MKVYKIRIKVYSVNEGITKKNIKERVKVFLFRLTPRPPCRIRMEPFPSKNIPQV